MTRLTRIFLMLGSAFGFAAAAPAPSQAGVIPWMYNAIFGPVGSLRAGYTPMYANYGGSGYAYSGYAPASVAYGPAVSSYGGGGGCSSCGQSANYAPAGGYDTYYGYAQPSYYGSTGCSSCSSGNCSNGSCSNCSPSTSGYSSSSGYSPAPIPDPNLNNLNSSTDVNHQLRTLREELRELKHQQAEDEKYIKEQHPTYRRQPYRPETYSNDRSEPVYPRGNTRNDTFPSRPSDRDYTPPRRSGAPTSEPLEEESRRPVLTAPDKEKSGGANEGVKEDEPHTMRLDSRITTRAVAPRDRKQIASKPAKSVIANSNKTPVKTTSESLRLTDLARH